MSKEQETLGQTTRRQRGFSLIELAIVLVIIALIAGGIFVGLEIKHGAELRTFMRETDTYIKVLGLFQDKYNALPGDMHNATDFWGTDADCPTTASNTIAKRATCNGGGNGRIGYQDVGGPDATNYEIWRAWQHLSNAGFIDKRFSGTSGSDIAYHEQGGIYNPASDMRGAGWSVGYNYYPAGDTHVYAATYGNQLWVGRMHDVAGGGYWHAAPFLTPLEAFDIDSKMDDGKPGQGKIITYKPDFHPNCASSNDPVAALYSVTYTSGYACAFNIITGF